MSPSQSTGLPLGRLRLTGHSQPKESVFPTEPWKRPASLSPLATIPKSTRRVLDFDLECVAAGFSDPAFVPVRVTAWAFCWIGSDDIRCEALPVADYYDADARRAFLAPLLDAVRQADVLTFHNGLRADMPWLQGECWTLGLERLGPVLVQDTIRIGKVRTKKGQDNLAHALGVKDEKLPLSWAQWEAAYAEPDLATVKERVSGDVRQHMQMRQEMIKRGWLGSPRLWRP